MARTRAQRRRRTLFITLALVVTLVALIFARDVSRSAHNAITAQRSENRSFGALANALITSENNFDSRLERLLAQGGTLSRAVFSARLDQLDQELPGWSAAADQLRRPILSGRINDELDRVTDQRVVAYQSLLGNVASALELPWTPVTSPIANPASVLSATSAIWNSERTALRHDPGRVRLDATTSASASYFARNGNRGLVVAPSLVLQRAIAIATIRVSPSPLPAGAGVWLLPPVSSLELGVSVVNEAFDTQPVTLQITVTPTSALGKAYSQTLHATLGPMRAFAFVPPVLRTAASEHAHVSIVLSGAPAAPGQVVRERTVSRCRPPERRQRVELLASSPTMGSPQIERRNRAGVHYRDRQSNR